MPEAFTLLAVATVVIVACIAASRRQKKPAHDYTPAEVERLRQHASWLEQRLATAERENWGDAMIANLSSEHAAALRLLAQCPVGRAD